MTHRGWVLGVLVLLAVTGLSGCLSGDEEKDVKTPTGDDTTDDTTGDTGDATDDATGSDDIADVADPIAPLAAFTINLTDITTGVEVGFDASATADEDTDAGNLTFAWDFGDGSTGDGINVTHAFASEGTFNVTLNVTDVDGLSNETSQTVTVASAFTGGVIATLTGTATAPNPIIGVNAAWAQLQTAGACATDLACAKALGVDGTHYKTFDLTIPAGAAYVEFLDGTRYGLHVFRADTGKRISGSSDIAQGNTKVVEKDADAFEHLNWVALVFSPSEPANAYNITVTALAEAPAA